MKFLFFAPRLHPNYNFRLKSLIEKGHEVKFLSLFQLPEERFSIVKPKIIGYSKFFIILNKVFNRRDIKPIKNKFETKYGYPSIFKLLLIIFKFNPDVIVVKNIYSIFSLLGLIIGKFLFKKNIVFMQIEKYRQKGRSRSVDFVNKIFKAKVITPILGDERYKITSNNLLYIPFAIEAKNYKKKFFNHDRINIVTVGKFIKRKDHLLLLHAVNRLRASYNLFLTVIGQKADENYLKQVLNYVEHKKLENMVSLKFNLIGKEVELEYEKHDLFILPSYNEPAAFSLLEAMSYQLPVISSDLNGTKCYVENGVNGYIFKNRNLDDLVDKIERIIRNKKNIMDMGEASLKAVKEKYSLEIFYNNFIKLV